jgi:hypothetical protein
MRVSSARNLRAWVLSNPLSRVGGSFVCMLLASSIRSKIFLSQYITFWVREKSTETIVAVHAFFV